MIKRILIVDDEDNIRYILTHLLEEKNYSVAEAQNGSAALDQLDDFSPDVILLDLEMPEMGGMETLKALREREYPGTIIIITAYGSIPSAVEAMRIGAFDYITKPFNNDEILMVIEKALHQERIERELAEARNRLDEKFSVKGIITVNSAMRKLLETVIKIAPTDNPVLINGDSGTGKELFANAVHQHSHRKNGSFVALNCGAIPGNLVESELFGYLKGAFSGAIRSKPGLVDRADGGTLFLDEIGEMEMDAQVKLLRFSESGEFFPVGGTVPKSVDVRIVAASNRDLNAAVSEGNFRQDLFYRLNVISLTIPPLRDRSDDIPLLIEHFIEKHRPANRKESIRLTSRAVKALQAHDWPGNVRELENVIRSAIAMADSTIIDEDDLLINVVVATGTSSASGLQEIVSRQQSGIEKTAIQDALAASDNNITHTAERLGIARNTLKKKMRQYGLYE